MLLRVVTAVTAAFVCTCPTIASAMVVSEFVSDIPSSFTANGGDPAVASRLRNPATAALADSMRIFARDPAHSSRREGGATQGITDPLSDMRPPSLEELTIIASVDPSRYIGPDGRVNRSKKWETVTDFGSEEERTRATIEDLAKALLNRNERGPEDLSRQNEQNQQDERTGTYKYFQAMLDLEIDKEFLSTAAEVIKPKVTPNGIVTLNLFGTRDFAFMTSPVSNNIQIVDFTTGLTLSVSHSEYNMAAVEPHPVAPRPQTPERERVRGPGSTPLLVKVLATTRELAIHPLTILSIVLLSTLGFLYRVIRGAEH